MDRILSQFEKFLIYAIVFLLPIIVLPISPNPFDVPKILVLTFGVGLILLVKSIKIITTGKLEFSLGSFDFPVLVIAIAYILGTIFRSPSKMDALLLPGTASVIIAGALFYYLVNQLSEKEKNTTINLLLYSGLIFATISLLATLNVLSKIPQLPAYAKLTSFNTAGGFLPATIVLATLLPLGLGKLFR